MARVKCKLGRRGHATIDWYKDGVPQYYCLGCIDAMTDEYLPECKECRDFTERSEDDFNAWRKERKQK